MDSLLKIESLKKYYGKKPNQTKALDGISFQVMPGEFLGIMGSSGSGKSTLLNCIATVIKPDSGTIELQGKEIQALKGAKLAQYRGREICYLFQNFERLVVRDRGLRPPEHSYLIRGSFLRTSRPEHSTQEMQRHSWRNCWD